jgi:hypothetical protein
MTARIEQEPSGITTATKEAYFIDPFNPEVITKLWREFLPEATIPPCNWFPEEIARVIPDMKGTPHETMMVPVPKIYRGPEGLERLGRRFRNLAHHAVEEGTRIQSEDPKRTWVQIEFSRRTPNLGNSLFTGREHDLLVHLRRHDLVGQTLETYILGSLMHKELIGTYFDEGSWVRLPGSYYAPGDHPVLEGGPITGAMVASFDVNGFLNTGMQSIQFRHPGQGGRSTRIIKYKTF